MHTTRDKMLLSILKRLACLLISKASVSVFLNYPNYIPPDFQSVFLRGRTPYFFGCYHWAFYAHIFSGSGSLILGLILISENLRRRLPGWHRWLGRIQVFNVLLLVTPSGLWMAFYAESGTSRGLALVHLPSALDGVPHAAGEPPSSDAMQTTVAGWNVALHCCVRQWF